MKKSIIFLFITVLLFASLGLVSNSAAHKNERAFFSPTPTPKESNSNEKLIILDKNRVQIACQGASSSAESCDDNKIVNVSLGVSNKVTIPHKITVSAGNIIEKDGIIQWDLTNVQPGLYEITVEINDGKGYKKSETENVEVVYCLCGGCCVCFDLSISSTTEIVKSGETIDFTASTTGASAPVNYQWKISDGEIIEGQDTQTIKVKTNSSLIGKTITATVEISSEAICSEVCPKTISKTIHIVK